MAQQSIKTIPAHRFEVIIGEGERVAFSRISGLSRELSVSQDGIAKTRREMIVKGQLLFERAFTGDNIMVNWQEDYLAKLDKTLSSGKREIQIFLFDRETGNKTYVWTIHQAWPFSISYNDLDASVPEILIETTMIDFYKITGRRIPIKKEGYSIRED